MRSHISYRITQNIVINARIDVSVSIWSARALKQTNVSLRKQFFYSNKFRPGRFDRSFWSSSGCTITLSHSIIPRCLNKRNVYAPTHRRSELALPVFISASNLPLYYIVSICFFWGKVMIVLSSYTYICGLPSVIVLYRYDRRRRLGKAG